ncbi:MAG: hypothetical protein LUH53_11155 [Lachnospiraceae bacterium]|nr:hypothetical protein [Lachnospiraceae bacterium]
MNPTIDVVIPTYKPDAQFREVLLKLMRQTRPPRQILLINTEKELFDESLLEVWKRPLAALRRQIAAAIRRTLCVARLLWKRPLKPLFRSGISARQSLITAEPGTWQPKCWMATGSFL